MSREVQPSQRKPRLDDDQRKVLEVLRDASEDGQGALVHIGELQKQVTLWIRQPLESLRRRRLVEGHDTRPIEGSYWKITDAGREALR